MRRGGDMYVPVTVLCHQCDLRLKASDSHEALDIIKAHEQNCPGHESFTVPRAGASPS